MDYISANAVHGAWMRLPQCRILNLGLQGETAAQKVAVLAQSQSPLPLRCLPRKKVHLKKKVNFCQLRLSKKDLPSFRSFRSFRQNLDDCTGSHQGLGTGIHCSIVAHNISSIELQHPHSATPVVAVSASTDGCAKTQHVLRNFKRKALMIG